MWSADWPIDARERLRANPRLLLVGAVVTLLRVAVVWVGLTWWPAFEAGDTVRILSLSSDPHTAVEVHVAPVVAVLASVLAGVLLGEGLRVLARSTVGVLLDEDGQRVRRALRGTAVAVVGLFATLLLAVAVLPIYLGVETALEAAGYAFGVGGVPWWVTVAGGVATLLVARWVVAAALDPAEVATSRAGNVDTAVRASLRAFASAPRRALRRAAAGGGLVSLAYALGGSLGLVGFLAGLPELGLVAGGAVFGVLSPLSVALAADLRVRGRIDLHEDRVPARGPGARSTGIGLRRALTVVLVLSTVLSVGVGVVRVGDLRPVQSAAPAGPVSPEEPPRRAVADALSATQSSSHVALEYKLADEGGDDLRTKNLEYVAYDRESRELVRVRGGPGDGSVGTLLAGYRSPWIATSYGYPASESHPVENTTVTAFRKGARETADRAPGRRVLVVDLYDRSGNTSPGLRTLGDELRPERAGPDGWRVRSATDGRILYETSSARAYRRVVVGQQDVSRIARDEVSVTVAVNRSSGYVQWIERKPTRGEGFIEEVTDVSKVGRAEVPHPGEGVIATLVDAALY